MDLTSSVDALVQKEKVFGAIQPLMAMSASGKSSFPDVELYVLFLRIFTVVLHRVMLKNKNAVIKIYA